MKITSKWLHEVDYNIPCSACCCHTNQYVDVDYYKMAIVRPDQAYGLAPIVLFALLWVHKVCLTTL